MTNVKFCDACDERIASRVRVGVQVYLRFGDVRLLDFHAEKECLAKLAKIVKDLTKEVSV